MGGWLSSFQLLGHLHFICLLKSLSFWTLFYHVSVGILVVWWREMHFHEWLIYSNSDWNLTFCSLSSQIKWQSTEAENKDRLEWWRPLDIYSSHLLFILINERLRSGDWSTEMGEELRVLNSWVNLSFLSLSSPLLTKCFSLQLTLICFPPHTQMSPQGWFC